MPNILEPKIQKIQANTIYRFKFGLVEKKTTGKPNKMAYMLLSNFIESMFLTKNLSIYSINNKNQFYDSIQNLGLPQRDPQRVKYWHSIKCVTKTKFLLKSMKFVANYEKSVQVLGVTPRGLPPKTQLQVQMSFI